MLSLCRHTRKIKIFNRYFQTSTNNFAKQENHYELLKLPFDASISEIKNKFKKISLKLHPDMLKSQGLSDEELNKKSDEYLKVKKSYEILSDDKKRNEYDLHLGIKRREFGSSSSSNSFFKRPSNSFHFHEKYRYNDVPHFDSKKHQERNERVEKMYMYNQKINQNIDRFGRDLYARTLGKNGPRKGIYKEYKYQPNIRDDESEGKKIAVKLVGGLIGLFTLWYIFLGNYSTNKSEEKNKNENKNKKKLMENQENKFTEASSIIEKKGTDFEGGRDTTTVNSEEIRKEKVNSVSKSGNKMNVNNAYGMMLIGGGSRGVGGGSSNRSDLDNLEEQISETSE